MRSEQRLQDRVCGIVYKCSEVTNVYTVNKVCAGLVKGVTSTRSAIANSRVLAIFLKAVTFVYSAINRCNSLHRVAMAAINVSLSRGLEKLRLLNSNFLLLSITQLHSLCAIFGDFCSHLYMLLSRNSFELDS